MKKLFFSAMATAALLTGCGGGGGGGGSSTQKLVCTTPATVRAPDIDILSTADATKVLKHVWDTTSVETLSYSMGKLWMTDIGRTITGSGKVNCSGGGSATITDTDTNQNALQVGDRLALSFADCRPKASSPLLNGSVTMEVTSVSNDPYTANSAWSLGLRTTFTNLQSNITAAGCGTVDLAMSTTGNGIYTGTVSGATYTVANTETKRTLSNYTLNFTEPELDASTGWPQAGGQAKLSGNGRVASADSAAGSLNGSVDFTVTNEFVGSYSNNQGVGALSQGQMRVDGANSTNVILTATSASTVDLDVGSNGSDGSFDWSDVLP